VCGIAGKKKVVKRRRDREDAYWRQERSLRLEFLRINRLVARPASVRH
jgi:hypothetical protein